MKKIKGATLVEFAAGAVIFFTLFFGAIALSIFLANRVIVARALDKALDRLVADPRFREDTHLTIPGEPLTNEQKWQRVNAARTDAINDAVNFLKATWIIPSLLEYQIQPPHGGNFNSPILLLRPDNGLTFDPQEEWVHNSGSGNLERTYDFGLIDKGPGGSGGGTGGVSSSCLRGTRPYSEVLMTCPYLAKATVQIKLFPFGKVTINVQSARYAELPNKVAPLATFQPWTTHQWGEFWTPSPYEPPPSPTPGGPPTQTATPTNTYAPTPTTVNTPFCEYSSYSAALAACEDPPSPPENCVQSCGTNGWNCKHPCTGV